MMFHNFYKILIKKKGHDPKIIKKIETCIFCRL